MASDEITGASRGQALACYRPPFRYRLGYIWDADNHMVADRLDQGFTACYENEAAVAALRVRGWGRLQYRKDCDPEALQDMIGTVIAEAMTRLWEAEASPALAEGTGGIARALSDVRVREILSPALLTKIESSLAEGARK